MKYIVKCAFNDRSAILFNTETKECKYFTEYEIVKLYADYDIIGAYIDTKYKKVDKIEPYDIIEIESLYGAYEYADEHNIDYNGIEKIDGVYYILIPRITYGIEYAIVSYRGEPNLPDYETWVGNKGYTNYMRGAATFDRKKAYEKVGTMNSKGGRKWEVIALVIMNDRVEKLTDILRRC